MAQQGSDGLLISAVHGINYTALIGNCLVKGFLGVWLGRFAPLVRPSYDSAGHDKLHGAALFPLLRRPVDLFCSVKEIGRPGVNYARLSCDL
ncbi:hypothetical protein CsSME_00028869 [Camellia sinensis var. sinensis]